MWSIWLHRMYPGECQVAVRLELRWKSVLDKNKRLLLLLLLRMMFLIMMLMLMLIHLWHFCWLLYAIVLAVQKSICNQIESGWVHQTWRSSTVTDCYLLSEVGLTNSEHKECDDCFCKLSKFFALHWIYGITFQFCYKLVIRNFKEYIIKIVKMHNVSECDWLPQSRAVKHACKPHS